MIKKLSVLAIVLILMLLLHRCASSHGTCCDNDTLESCLAGKARKLFSHIMKNEDSEAARLVRFPLWFDRCFVYKKEMPPYSLWKQPIKIGWKYYCDDARKYYREMVKSGHGERGSFSVVDFRRVRDSSCRKSERAPALKQALCFLKKSGYDVTAKLYVINMLFSPGNAKAGFVFECTGCDCRIVAIDDGFFR